MSEIFCKIPASFFLVIFGYFLKVLGNFQKHLGLFKGSADLLSVLRGSVQFPRKRFPGNHFPDSTFPGKLLPGMTGFPEKQFPEGVYEISFKVHVLLTRLFCRVIH